MAIPKIIHYCWLGRNPKPKSVLKCIESWKKYCPDYEIIEWNEDNLDISMNEYARQAYEAKAWGFVPDYLRLWIIYTYGGIYLDTDVQIIRSFDPLLKNTGFAGFENDEFIALGLGFGAEAGNPMIAKHMALYDDLRYRNEDGTYNRTPSPEYSTTLMKQLGLKPNNGTVQYIDGFACYPPEYFCPKSFELNLLKLTKNTFSIHHYDASWYTEEEHARRKHDMAVARARYITRIPRSLAEKALGTKRYKHMVASIKGLLPKGKRK